MTPKTAPIYRGGSTSNLPAIVRLAVPSQERTVKPGLRQ